MNVITGMHRSGTSMIANLLYEMGADFGDEDELLAADQWNKRGYYENREIFILNDAILLGEWAPSRTFWTTQPENRSLGLRLTMQIARMQYMLLLPFTGRLTRAALQRQAAIRGMQERYGDIVVKDPRMSLLIGEWAKIVPVEKVLYCYRHPFEVARSLQRRGSSPKLLGYLLWDFHVRQFLKAVEGLPLIVVNYNNYFSEASRLAEMRRLFNWLEHPFDEVEAKNLLTRVLDDRLKTVDHSGEQIPGFARATYAELAAWHEAYPVLWPAAPPAAAT